MQTETAICAKKNCLIGSDVPQPLDEFIGRGGKRAGICRTCRQAKAARRPVKNSNALNGYGQPPRRVFNLAPHHYLLDVHPWSKLGHVYAALHEDETKFKLLRAPDGRPVARRHAGLKPGQVSLVLE